tara:strand:- start:594 stop:1748 length:1155 start_codon:yes stop_codon:yes gene_type:complete
MTSTRPDPTDQPIEQTSAGPSRLSTDEITRIMRRLMPVAVSGIAVLAVLYTLYFAADLFLPLFFAVFLAIILRPIVGSLKHLGLPEAAGAGIVIACLMAAITVGSVRLSGPIEDWVDRLPQLERDIQAKLWPVTQSIKQAKQATEKIENLADGGAPPTREPMVTIRKPSLLNRMFKTTWFTAIQVLTTLVLTYFFLAQNVDRTRQTIRRLPWYKRQNRIEEMFEDVQATMSRFLQVSAMIYLCLGTLTAAAMYILDMPNPLLFGALAAVLGFIPYLGPVIVLGFISVVSLLNFDNWFGILAPPMAYFLLTAVEGYFITPAILGRRLKLSPIAVFLSMLLWTWVWGIAGALLSVPILVLIIVLTRHLIRFSRDPDTETQTGNEAA